MITPPALPERLDAELGAVVGDLLRAATDAATAPVRPSDPPRPAVPGAVAVVAHRGTVVARARSGYAELFDADGALLPEALRRPVGDVFDLASLTKLLTTTAALVQVDAGALDLDAAVADVVPEFADAAADGPARGRVTVHHLLTHTAGLLDVLDLWRTDGDRAARAHRVLAAPLLSEPGTTHRYSCVGFLVLGLLLERLTGLDLPALLATTVTGPLGMTSTGYSVAPGAVAAATEHQVDPPRGMVRGAVHDEAAWALGGAGNAGVFSTAEDLVRLGEMVRAGRPALLSGRARALLRTNVLGPEETARVGYGQALGFRVGDASALGEADPTAIGHTGFTGTSLVVDARNDLVVVLLTNRVHPARTAFDVGPLRVGVARAAREWAGRH
ncbi:serine hydrolase domain-containing protein [Georgenia faecalis]|uniref:Serine hydrolase domain-containing protein n=1 Tax=Georgenia faecalis TaxID=2483799 RepID=A0ABV9D629_9MICO|nr:serine hydrolase domain-containing protein [Georgenia faecalis]